MIDINELRPAVEAAGLNAISMQEVLELLDRLEAAEAVLKDFGTTAQEVECWLERYRCIEREAEALRTRLEAAESDALEQARLNGVGGEREAALIAKLEAAEKERDTLLARIEAMEKQEPGDILYLAPGAQPAQKEVAYLDLGTGGYMDIGTDLSDEQLASFPKGRHMLGIVGTYGVDGYVSAQPAPSVPENVMRDARRYLWLRNAALDWYVGPEYATYNDVVCSGECCNYAGGGVALDSAIDALLAAAPEAKPCP